MFSFLNQIYCKKPKTNSIVCKCNIFFNLLPGKVSGIRKFFRLKISIAINSSRNICLKILSQGFLQAHLTRGFLNNFFNRINRLNVACPNRCVQSVCDKLFNISLRFGLGRYSSPFCCLGRNVSITEGSLIFLAILTADIPSHDWDPGRWNCSVPWL